MIFKDLPSETKQRLLREQTQLHKKNVNTPYRVHIYNFLGTRYFYARRVCESWADDKGNSMPFGGGTHWVIAYGAVGFSRLSTYKHHDERLGHFLCQFLGSKQP